MRGLQTDNSEVIIEPNGEGSCDGLDIYDGKERVRPTRGKTLELPLGSEEDFSAADGLSKSSRRAQQFLPSDVEFIS